MLSLLAACALPTHRVTHDLGVIEENSLKESRLADLEVTGARTDGASLNVAAIQKVECRKMVESVERFKTVTETKPRPAVYFVWGGAVASTVFNVTLFAEDDPYGGEGANIAQGLIMLPVTTTLIGTAIRTTVKTGHPTFHNETHKTPASGWYKCDTRAYTGSAYLAIYPSSGEQAFTRIPMDFANSMAYEPVANLPSSMWFNPEWGFSIEQRNVAPANEPDVVLKVSGETSLAYKTALTFEKKVEMERRQKEEDARRAKEAEENRKALERQRLEELRTACDQKWIKVSGKDSVSGYETFLSECGESNQASTARSKIQSLKEERAAVIRRVELDRKIGELGKGDRVKIYDTESFGFRGTVYEVSHTDDVVRITITKVDGGGANIWQIMAKMPDGIGASRCTGDQPILESCYRRDGSLIDNALCPRETTGWIPLDCITEVVDRRSIH